MRYATRHDIQFTWVHLHAALWEVDAQDAFEHNKRFIGLWVRVPDKLTFDTHDLELVVIHFGDDPRAPLLLDQRSFSIKFTGCDADC